MIRLLVADDEALVRDGLRAILSAEPDLEVVEEATNGAEAVAAARRLNPDIVLMDVRMPSMDGVEACRQITASQASTRVLMLTTFGHDEYVYAAMRAGASGFLLKDVRRAQLVDALRAAASGDTILAPAIVRRLVESFCTTPVSTPPPALDALTSRERDVLICMARGLSNREIAGELFVSESTVKTHVMRVLAKLDLRDRVHAVIFAYEVGLLRPSP